ncbi:Cof-type HAD-IIB family hydrolase [Streptococcus pacificus]|uniref:HAD family phosphatase n=1 Tax=Streptococcus pacificus TaxID=2740577 RepID=A0ABS0ZGN2_9STRE|nr:Cof-type HAD-IIB family hydrolase [Streptococcus pacificus]MBJ8325170.1 HAD family phosphatase [Streptococcus pacificus]
MTQIKLLALDLDGTLFNSQKEVPFLNKIAITQAKNKGVKVVITTGRPLKAIGNLLEFLDLKSQEDYSITFNGGLIQKNNGDSLFQKTLSRKEVERITEMLLSLGLPVDILSDSKSYTLAAGNHHSLYPSANVLLDFHNIKTLDELPHDIVYNKVVSVFDADYLDQQLPKIPKQFHEAFEIFKSRDILLEMMPKGVDKGSALAILGEHLGIKREEMMAIGDEENDLSMLRWVGFPVAMKNASETVKKEITRLTSRTNDESGVAEAIEKYILREEKDGII